MRSIPQTARNVESGSAAFSDRAEYITGSNCALVLCLCEPLAACMHVAHHKVIVPGRTQGLFILLWLHECVDAAREPRAHDPLWA